MRQGKPPHFSILAVHELRGVARRNIYQIFNRDPMSSIFFDNVIDDSQKAVDACIEPDFFSTLPLQSVLTSFKPFDSTTKNGRTTRVVGEFPKITQRWSSDRVRDNATATDMKRSLVSPALQWAFSCKRTTVQGLRRRLYAPR
jgi:hypothetical protein